MANAKDVAAALGVSPSAVSIALNNKPGISEETRKRILRKAAEMGLEHKPRKNENENVIHFVMFSEYSYAQDNPFLEEVIEGMSHEARNLGYMLRITYLSPENLESGLKAIAAENTRGIILLGSKASNIDRRFTEGLGLPVVVLDRPSDSTELDSVVIHNGHGIYRAVEHLWALGHRRIAYVGPRPSGTGSNFTERHRAFVNCVRSRNEMLPSLEHIYLFESMVTDYSSAMHDLLVSVEKESEMPTAFVCATDWHAYACVNALRAMGYSVPGDVSVIGFDNISIASLSNPPLTTVNVPKKSMGSEAVRRLDYLICNGTTEHLKLSVLTSLAVRKSTGPAKDDTRWSSEPGTV